jgi:L-threonylcarbamoyladenylate synthase
MLRALDRPEVRTIAVMPVPGQGLGEAIRDRLIRAAAPRPEIADAHQLAEALLDS